MSENNYSMFFLQNVRSLNPKSTPKIIYRHFYKKIQEKQIAEFLILKKTLDLIDNKIRQINVVTEDLEEIKRIREITKHLKDLESEIRDQHAKPGSDFLDALKTVFTYNH